MLLLAYPVEPIGYVVHFKYFGKREHLCREYVVYVKTGTRGGRYGKNIISRIVFEIMILSRFFVMLVLPTCNVLYLYHHLLIQV